MLDGDRYERSTARHDRANQGVLAGTADVAVSTSEDQATRHRFVAKVLDRHRYFKLGKGHRGVLFAYLQRLTGYTRQHLTKLIGRYRREHHLHPATRASRTSFKSYFGPQDIALLAQLEALHNTLAGPATKVLLRRAWQSFGDTRYAKLAGISVSHLYNLRASTGASALTAGLGLALASETDRSSRVERFMLLQHFDKHLNPFGARLGLLGSLYSEQHCVSVLTVQRSEESFRFGVEI